MSDKMYKILWVDDENEKMGAFIRSAKQASIELVPFKSFKSGVEELERNFQIYDGVILDAQIFENENDVPGTENTKFVHRAKDRILGLPKKFEIFVLTGQVKAYDSDEFKNAFQNVFRKGVSEDEDNLFQKLKEAADKQIDTQIRHEHSRIFEILKNYEPDASKTMLEILCSIRNKSTYFNDSLYFTQLRIILESMFRKANEIGLLHDLLVSKGENQVNLTEASLFLSGEDTKHSKVRCKKAHFPKIIANSVKNFLFITGAASHTTKVDIAQHIDVQDYRNTINTPYLLYSLSFQLMDFLIWFDEYSKTNADYVTNIALWENIEYDSDNNKWENGTLIRIASNGWGTVETSLTNRKVSVHNNLLTTNGIKQGDNVRVTTKENTNAIKIELI